MRQGRQCAERAQLLGAAEEVQRRGTPPGTTRPTTTMPPTRSGCCADTAERTLAASPSPAAESKAVGNMRAGLQPPMPAVWKQRRRRRARQASPLPYTMRGHEGPGNKEHTAGCGTNTVGRILRLLEKGGGVARTRTRY
ncbi:hypothetical protein NDU88_002452 [Pleurodeles waltl]|uniref:Uncharacterized protein n=1 Tax=Pleurodeles waltl TaxID=8319 RepID=A0AAV7RCS2_PLEWA|nr:hypothetical protein NDU88_002452 [Pleurodeles waltl]